MVMTGKYIETKVYKLRRLKNNRGQYTWVINVPRIFVLRNMFPEKVRVEVYDDKLIVTPA